MGLQWKSTSVCPARHESGDSMFVTRKFSRFCGLTWSQWKGAIKQCAGLQVCQQSRIDLTVIARSQCTRVISDTSGSSDSSMTQTGPSDSENSLNSQHSELTQKGIGRFYDEQDFKMFLKPDQPPDAKILRVAIIGLPNTGKSTLTNSLMGWRVSSVSKKVHTTRKNTAGIYTQDNTQIVFLDTPGILSPTSRKKHNLERSLLIDPERSLHQAHLVCVLVDVSNRWTRNQLDPLILQVLHLHQQKPAILILNKVDLLQSKEMLLQITRTLTQGIVDDQPVGVTTKKTKQQRKQVDLDALFDAMTADKEGQTSETESHEDSSKAGGTHKDMEEPEEDNSRVETSSPEEEAWKSYFVKMRHANRAVQGMKGWPLFKRVFMISALSGDGVVDIKDYLLQSAKPGDWDYHSSLVTVQDPREVVLMCVREKLLEHLKQEVPHSMDLDIVLWEVDEDGMFNIIINVSAKNRRQVTILLGPKGQTIQKIASEAKQEMMNAFRCEMRLKLIAKVKTSQRR